MSISLCFRIHEALASLDHRLQWHPPFLIARIRVFGYPHRRVIRLVFLQPSGCCRFRSGVTEGVSDDEVVSDGYSITSGFGFDDLDLCSRELAGDYRGLATSDSGNPSGTILVTLRQDECTVRGSVTFPPCLPVTGVTGSAGFSSNFPVALQTVTPSPFLAV